MTSHAGAIAEKDKMRDPSRVKAGSAHSWSVQKKISAARNSQFARLVIVIARWARYAQAKRVNHMAALVPRFSCLASRLTLRGEADVCPQTLYKYVAACLRADGSSCRVTLGVACSHVFLRS